MIEGVETRFFLDIHVGDHIRLLDDSLDVCVKEVLSVGIFDNASLQYKV